MKAYSQKSRIGLGLSKEGWDSLVAFVADAQPILNATRAQAGIEVPPPRIEDGNRSAEPSFVPGGWVGQYPGDVHVYPEKFLETEYEEMLADIAGWIELWDLPMAAEVLPLYESEVDDERTVALGYSAGLRDFTEEILSQRPAVNVQRVEQTGHMPRGAIDFQKTIQTQAEGGTQLVYTRQQFSFDHPLNRLLVRFHAELEARLSRLTSESQLVEDTLQEHARYHRNFLESSFSQRLVNESLDQNLQTLITKSRSRRDGPKNIAELVELCESYLRSQTFTVDFKKELTLGLKPVSKMYELWVLTQLLERLESAIGEPATRREEGLDLIDIGPRCTLHYDRALREHSRLLANGLGSHPGRPDYALEIDGEILWVGDAKYSPVSNIGLSSYQQLLSYAVDLMPASGPSTATILHVDRSANTTCAFSEDYTVTERVLRPVDCTADILPHDVLSATRGG